MTLQIRRLQTLEEVRTFLDGREALDIEIHEGKAGYAFVADTLRGSGYTSD